MVFTSAEVKSFLANPLLWTDKLQLTEAYQNTLVYKGSQPLTV